MNTERTKKRVQILWKIISVLCSTDVCTCCIFTFSHVRTDTLATEIFCFHKFVDENGLHEVSVDHFNVKYFNSVIINLRIFYSASLFRDTQDMKNIAEPVLYKFRSNALHLRSLYN